MLVQKLYPVQFDFSAASAQGTLHALSMQRSKALQNPGWQSHPYYITCMADLPKQLIVRNQNFEAIRIWTPDSLKLCNALLFLKQPPADPAFFVSISFVLFLFVSFPIVLHELSKNIGF